jgi:hypothetical protein
MADTFRLLGGGWNSLNDMLNESSELQSMLDEATDKIFNETVSNLEGLNAPDYIKNRTKKTTLEPNQNTKIRVRLVSVPNAGYEMNNTPLGRALHD